MFELQLEGSIVLKTGAAQPAPALCLQSTAQRTRQPYSMGDLQVKSMIWHAMQAEIQSPPRSYFLQPNLCRHSGMSWYGLKTDLLKSEGSMFGMALLRPPGASKKHMSRWAPRVRILGGNFEMPFCFAKCPEKKYSWIQLDPPIFA